MAVLDSMSAKRTEMSAQVSTINYKSHLIHAIITQVMQKRSNIEEEMYIFQNKVQVLLAKTEETR